MIKINKNMDSTIRDTLYNSILYGYFKIPFYIKHLHPTYIPKLNISTKILSEHLHNKAYLSKKPNMAIHIITSVEKAKTHKRENGQYFTKGNCFKFKPFKVWFESIPDHKNITLIEPFAGYGDIPSLMRDAGYTNKWKQFDLYPQNEETEKRDSIENCPEGKCIITNPPYLAKNSATRRKLKYPDTKYDDLYKLALDKMLKSSSYVAAIIPESFITSKLFLDRTSKIISIKMKMFEDTDSPVCLALFTPNSSKTKIYNENTLIGDFNYLEKFLPSPKVHYEWKFNKKGGNIGLIAIDNSKTDTIKFVEGNNISNDDIKISSRAKTRISCITDYDPNILIREANIILANFREKTQDVFLTSFKGVREDGKYRRRLDFSLAASILDCAMEKAIQIPKFNGSFYLAYRKA